LSRRSYQTRIRNMCAGHLRTSIVGKEINFSINSW
jgi:hypothetical protein